ncbi:MAG: beta strand repeat-containing protein [Chlorobiota bacterium]
MRKFNLVAVLTLLICTLSVYGLEPSKVAYYTNNTAAQNVYVELKDYSSNTMLFRGETFSLAPNDNGIVIVNVNDYPAGGATGDWSGINASVINTSTMLDIYVNGTLFSQKRYDQLILVQAEATVLDNSGNFNPQTINGTIGTDDNRWDDVYVGGNTLHIGPDNGDLNNTEMELSYSANTGVISVNSVDALSLTPTNITISSLSGAGNRIVSANATGILSATTGLPSGDLVGTTDVQTLTNKTIDADNNTITNIENADIKANAGIDATKLADGSVTNTELQYINTVTSNVQTQLDGKQANITAGNGLSFSTNTLNVGGSSTIISNANNLEVNSSATANQVLLSSGTTGTAATFGTLPLSNTNSVSGTLPVANGGTGASTLTSGNFLQGNGTGAVSATKAVPTGAVVGTTDTQILTNKTIDADNNTITNIENADIKANAGIDAAKLADGSVSNTELQQLGSITSAVVGITDSQTLTNKSIDADNNTITNIENADIKANAGIDATKLADGSVSSTELQYINSVTSNVQTQLDGKQANLPSQSGNSGRYLTTDGTNLSWGTVSGGGGGGATIQTQTTTALTPIPTSYTGAGVTFTLDANSSYLVRGDFQDVEVGGTSGRFDTRFTYTGTFAHVHFSNFVSSVVLNESNVEDLRQAADNAGTTPSVIEGVITTTTGGTLTLQFRENVDSTNDVNINAGGTIVLIKM